ncbi:UNVERIFIED_CONTAM: protein MAINTENANCE OF MERISTEMS [Sesamum latifolium]|uniref:Protein MAINTENANCE OF MERISTEMS n=1 Tax=Sesamum latifolium TaxID=2727402 RepID=A0AAW2UE53_9LAMI
MIVILSLHWWRGGGPRHTLFILCREATITLQDVQVIWALPIDGEPVTGLDLDRTVVQWQDYCLTYLDFRPAATAFKGSRLQTHAIISHIAQVKITYDTPHEIIVQYACAVALLLLGGVMCLDSSGILVPLLYLTKLEDIVEARNYSWGSAVLAFLYRELCNATNKGKAAIGGALQLLQIWAWSCIIPLCPGLGAERVYMGQVQTDNNRLLPAAPYGATWNSDFNPVVEIIMSFIFYAIVKMHHPERVIHHSDEAIEATDTRDLHQISQSGQPGDAPMLQVVTNEVHVLDEICQSIHLPLTNEEFRQLVDRFAHDIQIIKETLPHLPQQITTSSDNAPTTSHRQRRSSSRMLIGSVERDNAGVDIAGPSTVYTPQDYDVPQPPQDYYVPQPPQDNWFQSALYMTSHGQTYSSHVDLDLGLGINEAYAPGYNISPIPFPSFSAYRDNVESSSAASSSRLHIYSGGDNNDE